MLIIKSSKSINKKGIRAHMEAEYEKTDIKGYREWLTDIGEDESEYTDAQILRLLAQDV